MLTEMEKCIIIVSVGDLTDIIGRLKKTDELDEINFIAVSEWLKGVGDVVGRIADRKLKERRF